MENRINENEEIELLEIIEIIRKNIYFIITFIVAGILMGLILSGVQIVTDPVEYRYKAMVTLELVNKSEMQNQPQTILHVMESNSILETSMTKLKINNGSYTVETAASTKPNQFDVIVEGPNQNLTAQLADEVVTQGRAIVSPAISMSRNSMVEKARVVGNPVPVSKNINIVLNAIIGAILGIMIGVMLIFIVRYMGGKVHTTADLERALGAKVMGVIPNREAEKKYIKFIRVR